MCVVEPYQICLIYSLSFPSLDPNFNNTEPCDFFSAANHFPKLWIPRIVPMLMPLAIKTTVLLANSSWGLCSTLEVSNEASEYFTLSPGSPSNKFIRSATAKNDHGPYHNRISDSSSGENTKQHEAVLSTEDEANASLPMSNIKENSRSQPFSSTTDTKLHGSFRKRLNTYTDNSAKPANEYEKSSTNSSPGPRGRRRFGHPGSVSVQANNLADSYISRATSVRSSVTQRSSGTQALLAHLLRPTSCLSSPKYL